MTTAFTWCLYSEWATIIWPPGYQNLILRRTLRIPHNNEELFMERLEELFVRRKVWQTHVHNLNEMCEQWNCETNVFLPSELILSNFLIKMNTKSRTTSEVKFPLWKKNQHPLKKVKYLLLLDWKTLSFLNWTLSMSEESI